MSAVSIRGLNKSYGTTQVLDAIDLDVAAGSITAVLGSSGCGKTTLLRIIAGFVRADAGTVAVEGRIVEDPAHSTAPEKRGVGYVPQEGALFPHLTVAGNIMFGLPRAERSRQRLAELLDLAELPADIAKRPPHQLSGGQQQRVALARALAPRPRVILLDEPFSSLDAGLRLSAGRSVTRVLRHAGATAIMVTHDQGEALSLADEVVVLRKGRVIQAASPSELYEAPADPAIAQFIGGATVLQATVTAGRADTALGVLEVLEVRGVDGVDGADGVVGADGGNEAVSVVIRPEQVIVGDPDQGAPATVTEVSYYGAQVVIHLALPDGIDVTARCSSLRPPAVGDRVGVRIDGPVRGFAATPENREAS